MNLQWFVHIDKFTCYYTHKLDREVGIEQTHAYLWFCCYWDCFEIQKTFAITRLWWHFHNKETLCILGGAQERRRRNVHTSAPIRDIWITIKDRHTFATVTDVSSCRIDTQACAIYACTSISGSILPCFLACQIRYGPLLRCWFLRSNVEVRFFRHIRWEWRILFVVWAVFNAYYLAVINGITLSRSYNRQEGKIETRQQCEW